LHAAPAAAAVLVSGLLFLEKNAIVLCQSSKGEKRSPEDILPAILEVALHVSGNGGVYCVLLPRVHQHAADRRVQQSIGMNLGDELKEQNASVRDGRHVPNEVWGEPHLRPPRNE
jgi:hypothetical protein